MMDAQEGRCLEVVGEVHHSAIAHKLGIRQDGYMLPEFHPAERSVVFDHGPRTLQEHIALAVNGASLTTRDAGAGDFMAEAWGRTGDRSKMTPFNDAAIRRIDKFLVDRFGSAGAFTDFIEPQWGIAQPYAEKLLIPQARVLDPTSQDVGFKINGLRVEGREAPMIHFTAVGGVKGEEELVAAEDCRAFVAIDGAGKHRDIDAPINKVEVAGGKATIEFSLPYKRIMDWMDNVDLGELSFEASLMVASRVGFDDFKRLFKEARNRVHAWKKDVKSFVCV